MAKKTTFLRLSIPDQLRVVRKVKSEKNLLEVVQMLFTVDPLVSIWNDNKIVVHSAKGLFQ